jgi:hypothetical protein
MKIVWAYNGTYATKSHASDEALPNADRTLCGRLVPRWGDNADEVECKQCIKILNIQKGAKHGKEEEEAL